MSTGFTSKSFAHAVLLPLTAILFLLSGSVSGQVDYQAINPFGDSAEQPDDGGFGTEGEGEGEGAAQPEQIDPNKVNEEGKALMEQGDYGAAVTKFAQIIGLQPNYVPAYLDQSKCYIELGEAALANQTLDTVIQMAGTRNPEIFAEASGLKADVMMDMGLYQDVVDNLNAAIQLTPSDPALLFKRGKALIRLASQSQAAAFGGGEETGAYFQQAIDSLTRSIGIDEDQAEAYVERSQAYTATGRLDKSIDDLEQATELESDNTQYKAKLGYAYLGRAQREAAKPIADKNEVANDYQQAIAAFSQYIDVEGQKDKSEFEDMEDPTAATPEQIFLARSGAQLSLAKETGSTGLYSAAQADADSAYNFNDDYPVGALYQRGVAQRLQGDLDAASKTFTEVIDFGASQFQPEALIRRGIIYFYKNDFEAARGDFRQSTELTGGLGDARPDFWTGATYAKEGRYQEAIRHYSKSIRSNPAYKPSYNNRGLVYMALGQYGRAARDFEELVRKDSKDNVARRRLEQARQMMRR